MGMKSKTIKAVLRKKVDDWLASIEDEQVRALASRHALVTGGCITSMLLGEKINDFDIYFTDRKAVLAVAHYYVQRFKPKQAKGVPFDIYVADGTGNELPADHVLADGASEAEQRVKVVVRSAGVANEDGTNKPYQYFEAARSEEDAGAYVADVLDDPEAVADLHDDIEQAVQEQPADAGPRYRPVFMSSNAITLSHHVQVILRFYGEADAIHENYDYVHCTNYWLARADTLVLRQPALEATLARELRYVGSKYPICSLIRMRKFIKRGWSINAGQVLKMCMQVSQLNLQDVRVLEDQLTGVDVAYFNSVIDKLRDSDPEKVNYTYLIEIIDRMF